MLRMTLLAKMTTPMSLDNVKIDDYRFIHLTHSDNDDINILDMVKTKSFSGLQRHEGHSIHQTWFELLSDSERSKFYHGYWNQGISSIKNTKLRDYLSQRYE